MKKCICKQRIEFHLFLPGQLSVESWHITGTDMAVYSSWKEQTHNITLRWWRVGDASSLASSQGTQDALFTAELLLRWMIANTSTVGDRYRQLWLLWVLLESLLTSFTMGSRGVGCYVSQPVVKSAVHSPGFMNEMERGWMGEVKLCWHQYARSMIASLNVMQCWDSLLLLWDVAKCNVFNFNKMNETQYSINLFW